jgi:hypothetical protein
MTTYCNYCGMMETEDGAWHTDGCTRKPYKRIIKDKDDDIDCLITLIDDLVAESRSENPFESVQGVRLLNAAKKVIETRIVQLPDGWDG